MTEKGPSQKGNCYTVVNLFSFFSLFFSSFFSTLRARLVIACRQFFHILCLGEHEEETSRRESFADASLALEERKFEKQTIDVSKSGFLLLLYWCFLFVVIINNVRISKMCFQRTKTIITERKGQIIID